MTFSTEDLRNLADLNGLCGDLATELLAARAKLEAAEKLAEAVKIVVPSYDPDFLVDALAAYEALK